MPLANSYPSYILSRIRVPLDAMLSPFLFTLRPEPQDLSQKTAIVTGANGGIGLETARKFAAMGATVILACRNREKADAARNDILSSTNVNPGKVEVILVDCVDLESVKKFVSDWGNRPLDILVNNAGISVGKYSKSAQGFESSYTTNVLASYLLSTLLLPNMNKHARIVNVSSVAHYNVKQQLDINDLDHAKALSLLNVNQGDMVPTDIALELYSRTKLMQMSMTREMQERLDKSEEFVGREITVHCCHPGLVKSAMWTGSDSMQASDGLLGFVNRFGISPEQGACTGVHAAVSEEAAQNKGNYWSNMGLRCPSRLVEDVETRWKMWDKWAEQCRLERARL